MDSVARCVKVITSGPSVWSSTADWRMFLASWSRTTGPGAGSARIVTPSEQWPISKVVIALAPATETFSVLRALRVLRVLRVISAVPSMRGVVRGLLSALPGLGAVVSLLALIFYVAAVVATKLFGGAFPEWFGTLGPACTRCSRS